MLHPWTRELASPTSHRQTDNAATAHPCLKTHPDTMVRGSASPTSIFSTYKLWQQMHKQSSVAPVSESSQLIQGNPPTALRSRARMLALRVS